MNEDSDLDRTLRGFFDRVGSAAQAIPLPTGALATARAAGAARRRRKLLLAGVGGPAMLVVVVLAVALAGLRLPGGSGSTRSSLVMGPVGTASPAAADTVRATTGPVGRPRSSSGAVTASSPRPAQTPSPYAALPVTSGQPTCPPATAGTHPSAPAGGPNSSNTCQAPTQGSPTQGSPTQGSPTQCSQPGCAPAGYHPSGRRAVTGIDPSSGPPSGGTQLTITGTGLTGATGVLFGDNSTPLSEWAPGTNFREVSDTEIQVTAPASPNQAQGEVQLYITGWCCGTSSDPSGFYASGSSGNDVYYTYAYPYPQVSAIGPTQGPAAGGTEVEITGYNLAGASQVLFGTAPAASFTVVSAHQIDAVSPSGSPGTVDVRVQNAEGTSPTTSGDQYTYT